MSHQSEWQPKAGELLEKIVCELWDNDGVSQAGHSAGHKDMALNAFANLQQAFGPMFESYTVDKDGYSARQTKSQATFFFSLISDMMSLIAAGFESRLNDQALNRQADDNLDSLINRYGEDDYPASVAQMIGRGQELELQAILSSCMKKAAAMQGDKFFDMVAEMAVKRSSASNQTITILSMFHDIVGVKISGNRRDIATSRGAVEATMLDNNVYQVNFGNHKSLPPAKTSRPGNIAQ